MAQSSDCAAGLCFGIETADSCFLVTKPLRDRQPAFLVLQWLCHGKLPFAESLKNSINENVIIQ